MEYDILEGINKSYPINKQFNLIKIMAFTQEVTCDQYYVRLKGVYENTLVYQ